MRLIHLTDPHLSSLDDVRIRDLRGKRWSGYLSWRKNRRSKYLPAILEKLLAAVHSESADQVLLTGDLVHIGLDSEFEQANHWLGSLGSPDKVMLVPGNHDAYAPGSMELFTRRWGDYLFPKPQEFSSGFPVLRKLDGLSLIGLSTACVTPLFMAGGRLGDRQLRQLEALLSQAADECQRVILLLHHPPLPGMTSRRKGLGDAPALQGLLECYPPMLICHGHLHHNREYILGDSRVYCTAAASSITDASYRVIDIEDQGTYSTVRMTLKTVTTDERDELTFVTADEQTWQVPGALKAYGG